MYYFISICNLIYSDYLSNYVEVYNKYKGIVRTLDNNIFVKDLN